MAGVVVACAEPFRGRRLIPQIELQVLGQGLDFGGLVALALSAADFHTELDFVAHARLSSRLTPAEVGKDIVISGIGAVFPSKPMKVGMASW